MTVDGGTFSLVSGDIDYVGISGLVAGDTLTASTMPMGGTAFDVPDTIIGVYKADGTAVCWYDDAFHSDAPTAAEVDARPPGPVLARCLHRPLVDGVEGAVEKGDDLPAKLRGLKPHPNLGQQ